MDEAHHYDIEVGGGEASVIARIGPLRQGVARRPVPPGPVTLVIDVCTTDLPPPTVTSAEHAASEPLGVEPNGPDCSGACRRRSIRNVRNVSNTRDGFQPFTRR
jgi:hypothetical protein